MIAWYIQYRLHGCFHNHRTYLNPVSKCVEGDRYKLSWVGGFRWASQSNSVSAGRLPKRLSRGHNVTRYTIEFLENQPFRLLKLEHSCRYRRRLRRTIHQPLSPACFHAVGGCPKTLFVHREAADRPPRRQHCGPYKTRTILHNVWLIFAKSSFENCYYFSQKLRKNIMFSKKLKFSLKTLQV